MINNYDIIRGFVKEEDIEKVLDEFATKSAFELDIADKKAVKTLERRLKQQIYFKLSLIFKRQIQLNSNEAIAFYNANIDVLKERINLLYHIIEKINCEMNLIFIPDKLTIASYLRISADTFISMLEDATVLPETQQLFRELNEYILSMTQAGLENGVLNNYAWHRLQLKGKFGGQDIEIRKESETQKAILITSDIQRKLASDYDFTALLENKTEEKKEG